MEAGLGKRHHLWAVAGLLVGRYGNRASSQAEAYARQAERDGDDDACSLWNDVAGNLNGCALALKNVPQISGD